MIFTVRLDSSRLDRDFIWILIFEITKNFFYSIGNLQKWRILVVSFSHGCRVTSPVPKYPSLKLLKWARLSKIRLLLSIRCPKVFQILPIQNCVRWAKMPISQISTRRSEYPYENSIWRHVLTKNWQLEGLQNNFWEFDFFRKFFLPIWKSLLRKSQKSESEVSKPNPRFLKNS